MIADTFTDLALCVAERGRIVARIRQLETEGSVRASYIEKLEWQLRGLDAWITQYRECIASDRGGCMGTDPGAVLMDRALAKTYETLERQGPRVVAAAVAQPSGDRPCLSSASRPVLYAVPQEPVND